MALSVTTTNRGIMGSERVVWGTITLDNDYAPTGEPFALADIGIVDLRWISFNQGEDGLVFHYDYTNNKILVFESGTASAALDEADDNDNLSAVVVEFMAIGR